MHKFLEASADWFPKRVATIFYGSTLTYQQLDRRVNQFAHALQGMKIFPGDRVMLVLPNMPQIIVAYYATLKVGGVVVLPNTDADAAKIIEAMRQTKAKVLVTLSEFAQLAEHAKEQLPLKVVYADIRNAVSPKIYKQLLGRWQAAGFAPQDKPLQLKDDFVMDALMMDASREPPEVEVSTNDLAAILFTSGTTQEPKGVCLTHGNIVANALQTRHWIPDLVSGKEVFLSVIPLTHSYGMTGAMNIPIAMGATIVLLPVFELQQVLDHIKMHKPTIFPGVPSIYTAVNNAPNVRSYGLSSIKACISGASATHRSSGEVREAHARSFGRRVWSYRSFACDSCQSF